MTDYEEFLNHLYRIHAGGWHPDSIPGKNAKAEVDEFVRRLKYEAWEECFVMGDDASENPYCSKGRP